MKDTNTKKEWKYFTIAEYEKEAAYLSGMHAKGWKLVRIDAPIIYVFERCEPEEVVYQLDYNPDGRNRKADYTQLFADMGWEYLFDFVGFSYFRKPVKDMQEGGEEIFCDDESRREMMLRVVKGRLPMAAALFLLALALLAVVLSRAVSVTGMLGVFAITFAAALAVLCVLLLVSFIRSYQQLKRPGGR